MKKFTFKKVKKKLVEIISHRYIMCKLLSFMQYSKYNPEKIEYIQVEKSSYVEVSPVSYINEDAKKNEKAFLPERYIVRIPNAKIIGNSNVIITDDNTVLYDMLYECNNNFNVTDKGLFRILDSTVHIGSSYVINYKSFGGKIEKAICLTGNFSKNLYHFMYELIAKSYLVVDKSKYIDYPIIVSKYVRDIPQFQEISRIFFKNRKLIYINSEEILEVGELIFPSFCNQIPPNYKDINTCKATDIVFDIRSLNYLRSKVLMYAQEYKFDLPKKIFISRKSTSWRSYNEDEIMKVVCDYGFQVVYPEELSYLQQVCLFRDAKYIIAASGAALTNIIACSKGCNVLAFVSSRIDLSIFSTIAALFDVNMKYMVGEITNDIGVQSDFIIDSRKLRTYLENGIDK